MESGPGRTARIWYQALLATALLQSEKPAKAQKAAGLALSLVLKGSPVARHCIHAYSCIAQVYLFLLERHPPSSAVERKALEKAAQLSSKTLKKCARVFPAAASRHHRLRGTLLWLRGQKASAERQWRESIEAARRYEMRHEEALCALELGRHLTAGSAERQLLLQRAVELLNLICPESRDAKSARSALAFS
jgi:hypothetical protein